ASLDGWLDALSEKLNNADPNRRIMPPRNRARRRLTPPLVAQSSGAHQYPSVATGMGRAAAHPAPTRCDSITGGSDADTRASLPAWVVQPRIRHLRGATRSQEAQMPNQFEEMVSKGAGAAGAAA